MLNNAVRQVTQQIQERSKKSRDIYLGRINDAKIEAANRSRLGCSNLAHAIAPMSTDDKISMVQMKKPNIAIITAYNDMLSAHQPYETYPNLIKKTLHDLGATAQVAGAVPAMCDGVTQSQPGMELSLFSRDNIAMGTAIGLSHNVYDGALYLGVCDKIVPGLLIGAMAFGHLPGMFIPSGPMPSGISNAKKAKVRQEFAKGNVGKDAMLEVESASYHSCGTCTFFGTANSNQMFLEMMGLQLPNSSFVNTNTDLRTALTKQAAKNIINMSTLQGEYKPIADIVDERSFVNAIVGLMATGGSTNHTMHLIAMAKVAGIILTWEDFDQLSKITPLLCKMYPNGQADVNNFRDAGGMSVVINQLLNASLIHGDVETIVGKGLDKYVVEPMLKDNKLSFETGAKVSKDKDVISSVDSPFSHEGGLKLLTGNIGYSIIKTSALKKDQMYIKEKVIVFHTQEELQTAFREGKLEKDFIAVVRYQGPKANGMPELHGLMPLLGVLQDRGFKVAIVTDGRMSGASGKVPSAIHISPEAADNGILAKIQTDDIIILDIEKGTLQLLLDEKIINNRKIKTPDLSSNRYGFGRELFVSMRNSIGAAHEGASMFDNVGEERA